MTIENNQPREKPCDTCGTVFHRKKYDGRNEFKARRFCSRLCYHRWRKDCPPVPSPEERLWKHVVKGPSCWEWQARTDKFGYGQLKLKGKWEQAHRLSYRLAHGSIADGLLVLHRCDSPPCVRPDHLFLGTAADNMKDMVQKGRSSRGVNRAYAKLDDQKVREIRNLRSGGLTLREIGERFGVSWETVGSVLRGRTWTHV